mmetsp:Transcript_1695/g.5116  ORF Transcript_1695/g.5116 Transcript_1695/m.5116 type:complete len:206 (-) Transcript_1695:676-1293(-)
MFKSPCARVNPLNFGRPGAPVRRKGLRGRHRSASTACHTHSRRVLLRVGPFESRVVSTARLDDPSPPQRAARRGFDVLNDSMKRVMRRGLRASWDGRRVRGVGRRSSISIHGTISAMRGSGARRPAVRAARRFSSAPGVCCRRRRRRRSCPCGSTRIFRCGPSSPCPWRRPVVAPCRWARRAPSSARAAWAQRGSCPRPLRHRRW